MSLNDGAVSLNTIRVPGGSAPYDEPVPPPRTLPSASSTTAEYETFCRVRCGSLLITSPATSPSHPCSAELVLGSSTRFASAGGCPTWRFELPTEITTSSRATGAAPGNERLLPRAYVEPAAISGTVFDDEPSRWSFASTKFTSTVTFVASAFGEWFRIRD